MFDVPTNGTQSDTGAGGEVSANYATLNPLQAITNSPTNGNLEIGGTSTGTYSKSVSTIHIDPEDTTGYYCEFTVVATGSNAAGHIQLIPQVNVTNSGKGESGGVGLGMRGSSQGNRWYKLTDQASGSDTGVSHAANQVIGVAVKNGKLYMAINNTWVLSGNPATESSPLYSSLSGLKGFLVGTLDGSWKCNWGQRAFTYSPPTGYRPVSSASLPTPTIADPSDYFDILLWTGNNATSRTFTGLDFAPDFIWHSARSIAWGGGLVDAVRGVGSGGPTLRPFNSSAEETVNNFSVVSALTSDGFTVTKGSHGSYPSAYLNQNNETYVAWAWDAGSSTVTNSDGNDSSNVRVNQTAGISIVGFTPTGTNRAIGHGLNVVPSMVIYRNRSGYHWRVYHASIGTSKSLFLNLNEKALVDNDRVTAITSSTFTVGSVAANDSHIAYCFTSIPGFSLISSYEGNGSADGPFVYCGFRPRWIMMKNADTAGTYYDWRIIDADRHTYNHGGNQDIPPTLFANASDQERDWDNVDILSNGFKIKDSSVSLNETNATQVFIAFAENPFQANGGLAR
jgi:hypothetical protein